MLCGRPAGLPAGRSRPAPLQVPRSVSLAAAPAQTLDQLRPGQSAQISGIEGIDSIASRLRELGFICGQSVQLLRVAPLGDPIKCAVAGSRVAVRATEARRVRLAID